MVPGAVVHGLSFQRASPVTMGVGFWLVAEARSLVLMAALQEPDEDLVFNSGDIMRSIRVVVERGIAWRESSPRHFMGFGCCCSGVDAWA